MAKYRIVKTGDKSTWTDDWFYRLERKTWLGWKAIRVFGAENDYEAGVIVYGHFNTHKPVARVICEFDSANIGALKPIKPHPQPRHDDGAAYKGL